MTENLNLKYLRIMSTALMLPIVTETIALITEGNGSRYTAMVYLALLCYAMYVCRGSITSKNIFILGTFYVFFALNYLFFTETQEFYDIAILMVLFFFLPIAVFVVRNIRDWTPFFKVFYPFSVFGIVIASVIVFTYKNLEFSGFFSYMEFSYGMLPCLICIYENLWGDLSDRFKKRSLKYSSSAILILGIVTTVVYGARATFFYFLIYIAFSKVVKRQLSARWMVLCSFLGIVVVILMPYIEMWLENLATIGIFRSSRLLTKFVSGELMESTTRDDIYRLCMQRIENVGIGYYGVFGDRPYCGSVYPHNIVFELLMSYGWLIGSVFFIFLVILVYKSLLKSSYGGIALFFVCAFLMRYFVSGSYVIEGRFWIMLFGLISLLDANKRSFNIQKLK